MTERHPSKGDRPEARRYEIRLAGHLDAHWATWFDGLAVSHQGDGTTVIRGPVADQAALHGLLQRVRDLGLPLVSVTRVDTDQPDPPPPIPASPANQETETDMTRTQRPTTTKGISAMTSSRKTALAVGVLFILTFITSIAGVFAYGPVLTDPAYILSAGPDTGVFMGAFLELLLIITNIGCAVVLFPLLKRQNEGLALGYVTARLVECGFIAVGLLSLLTVATLRQRRPAARTRHRSSRSASRSSRCTTGRSCSAPASPTASGPG